MLEESSDPQDETRVENLGENWSRSRASSPTSARAPRSTSSSSAWPWWPTPTRSLTTTAPAGSYLMTLHTAKGLEFPVVFLDRARGRRLPARPLDRRRQGAGGGAAARLRRADPAQQRLYVSRASCGRPGGAAAQPAVPLRRRAPRRPGRLAPYRGGADPLGEHVGRQPLHRRWRPAVRLGRDDSTTYDDHTPAEAHPGQPAGAEPGPG